MNLLADAAQWWNLIYEVPFGLGVLLTTLSVLGGSRHGGHAGHGSHIGHGGVSHGAGHTVPSGHAGHSHAQAHGDARHRGQDGKSPFSLTNALHVQNIPPLMIAQNLLLFWGIAGWAANQVLGHDGANPAGFVVDSLLIAAVCSIVLTIVLSATLARFTPGDETFAVSKIGLEGRPGEAVSPVTEKSGSVYARDDNGTLHHLHCRVRAEADPIKKGAPVLVCEYNSEGDFYWVKRWSPEEEVQKALSKSVAAASMPPRQVRDGPQQFEKQ